MHKVKEKVSNTSAATKEHIDVIKARAEEMEAKAMARSKEEKKIAEEVRKAKEAEAQMILHQTHAENAAKTLRGKYARRHTVLGHHHHQPVGAAVPTTGAPASSYPLGGHPPGHHHKYP